MNEVEKCAMIIAYELSKKGNVNVFQDNNHIYLKQVTDEFAFQFIFPLLGSDKFSFIYSPINPPLYTERKEIEISYVKEDSYNLINKLINYSE
jgi:hypothetical protein